MVEKIESEGQAMDPPDLPFSGKRDRRTCPRARCWWPPAASPTPRVCLAKTCSRLWTGARLWWTTVSDVSSFVYAIGDVTGGPQLAHAASAQGSTLWQLWLENPLPLICRSFPPCVYTDSEIATVGLTAAEAKPKEWRSAPASS